MLVKSLILRTYYKAEQKMLESKRRKPSIDPGQCKRTKCSRFCELCLSCFF